MKRITLAACLSLGAALAAGCGLPLDESRGHDMAEVRLTAVVAGTPIGLLVVIATAADIPTPLVFNLTAQNGVAQGTIRLPPGEQRKITVQAFDTDGILVAEGSKTIDVKPGQNPPVSIPVVSKAGQVTITVTLGPVSVVVQPLALTVQAGATQQLTATITAANGDVLAGPASWATTNPAIAAVDQNGTVTGVQPGTADIVATFAGVAALSHVSVAPPPAVSRIAFTSDPVGLMQIFAMNADGTNVVQLSDNTAFDVQPAWSPDGTRMAFASNRAGNGIINDVYVMNADGTNVVRLTSDPADDQQPVWSPDGTRIAFVSNRDGNNEIYVMNADGTSVVRLTNDLGNDVQPAWSPDATKIAFVSNRTGNNEIYAMHTDGTNVVRLTTDNADDGAPAWSPDGTQIALRSNRDGNPDIYVMHADGTNAVRLTRSPTLNDEPAWSPDGTRIAFVSNRGRPEGRDIYVMNADGTNVLRLTTGPADNIGPRWRPR